MGLMDSLKKATGLGLNANEHYDRAYEKAVLLGPANFPKAVELFDAAAKKAEEAGDRQLATRARANAALYGFITSGGNQYLQQLRDTLPSLTELERIGSKSEMMPSSSLLAEVEARLQESGLPQGGSSPAIVNAHKACSQAFQRFFNAPLVTYQYQHSDEHRETAQSRFFLHSGMASLHEAMLAVPSNPETAAENMAKALSAFRQCRDDTRAQTAEIWLTNCRQRRTCYLCHREVQGATIHFRTFPASISPYVVGVVKTLGQDPSTLDATSGTMVLCEPCGSVVERIADRFAAERVQELRQELTPVLEQHQQAIVQLANRLADLEKVAHHH